VLGATSRRSAAVGVVLAAWVLYQPVWAALRTHPYFAIKNVVIRGAGPLLTQDEILAWLGVQDGTSLWDVSAARVRMRLELHPLISHAAVRREFPRPVRDRGRERQPEAIAVLDGLYYLDRDGQVLKALASEHNRDYPLITGLDPDADPGYRSWALRRALRLVRSVSGLLVPEAFPRFNSTRSWSRAVSPRSESADCAGLGSWREKLNRAARVLAAWEVQIDRLARVDRAFPRPGAGEIADARRAGAERQGQERGASVR